jgi:Ca2+-binding EF-hand superfamily protein
MAMMRSSAMQQPPQGKNVFQLSDTDSNGLVSSTELETLASGIEKTTGSTINVDDALSSYDADQDGALNGEELFQMMEGLGFAPPEMAAGENGQSSEMPPPPPPPSAEQVTSAYSQNSGDDMLSELLDLLQSQENTDTNAYSSVNLTS